MELSQSRDSRGDVASHDALTLIRQATALCHAALEQAIDWPQAFSTPTGYVELLRRFHRVVEPLERELQPFVRDHQSDTSQSGTQSGTESKSAQLRRDIEEVQSCYRVEPSTDDGTGFKPEAAMVTTESAAWGVRYVLEGSALGGQILSRHLQACRVDWQGARGSSNPGCSSQCVIDRYFSGRGCQTGSHWKQFCQQLSVALPDAEAVDQAVRAAVRTFELFHSSFVGKAVCVRS